MARRHGLQLGDWDSVFGRLEELVLANSGEDEFEELFKLIVAKLWVEKRGGEFGAGTTPGEAHRSVEAQLAGAARAWPGILEAAHTHLTPDHLQVCVDAIREIEFSDTHLEVLDSMFESLVSRSSKGSKGQYFTPRHVVDCCVQIAAPGPEERIIDPACGSGGFLVHAFNYAQERHGVSPAQYGARCLWGADLDSRALRVAKALMVVAGDGGTNLYRANSLLRPEVQLELTDSDQPTTTLEDVLRSRLRGFSGFDVVLTNPPFAGEIREPGMLQGYSLANGKHRIERDVLFLERSLELLRPGGRIAIVLPYNKLGASQWLGLREWLLRRARVVAVLGLGRHTFQPHTAQKAEVLFATKRESTLRSVPDEPVLFMVSEKEGKDSKGKAVGRVGASSDQPAWLRLDHDLADAVDAFREFVDRYSIPWGGVVS